MKGNDEILEGNYSIFISSVLHTSLFISVLNQADQLLTVCVEIKGTSFSACSCPSSGNSNTDKNESYVQYKFQFAVRASRTNDQTSVCQVME